MHQPKTGLAMLFGVEVWAADRRAQICFYTSAFRDLWISGRAHMAKARLFSAWRCGAIGILATADWALHLKLWAGECGRGGLLFGFWHRAGGRLRNRLDVIPAP